MQYTIRNVNKRGEWRSRYATTDENDMVDWAIALEGESGWIKLSQKTTSASPAIGQSIEGNITDETSRTGESYKKFKKVNPNFPGNRSSAPDNSKLEQRLEYAIKILEQLNGTIDEVREGTSDGMEMEDPFPDL